MHGRSRTGRLEAPPQCRRLRSRGVGHSLRCVVRMCPAEDWDKPGLGRYSLRRHQQTSVGCHHQPIHLRQVASIPVVVTHMDEWAAPPLIHWVATTVAAARIPQHMLHLSLEPLSQRRNTLSTHTISQRTLSCSALNAPSLIAPSLNAPLSTPPCACNSCRI